ncbi:MAG: hypothetical protein ACLFTK_15330 [Anaerolineales bacterium]
MSVTVILQQIRTLSRAEQEALVKHVLAELEETETQPKKSLKNFRGVGERLYDSTDAPNQVESPPANDLSPDSG